MPIDLLNSVESFSDHQTSHLVTDLGFSPAPWLLPTARPKAFHTFLSSFTAAGGDPNAAAAGGAPAGAAPAGGGEGKDASGGSNCEEMLDFQLENGKEIQLCGDSEEQCQDDCKNNPDMKDQPYDENNKSAAALSVATGGEQQMLASCTRFCKLEFEMFCFPGDSTVTVRDRGRVQLANLQLGDHIMVMRGTPAKGAVDLILTFEPVIAWLHFDPHDTVSVVRLRHTMGELHATPGHLVYSRRPGSAGTAATVMAPIFARDVKIGDHLLAPWVDGTLAEPKVLEIERSSKKGLYAPLVGSGALLVDGTAVSCYAMPTDISEDPFYSKVFRHIAGSLGREGIHDTAHTLFLPFRLWSSSLPALPAPQTSLDEQAAPPEDEEFFEFTAARKRVPSPILPYAWFFYVVFKSFVI